MRFVRVRVCAKKTPTEFNLPEKFFLARIDPFDGFWISPYTFNSGLFFFDASRTLKSAVAGPSGGGAADIYLHFVPAMGDKRSIQRRVISGKDHGSIVFKKR